MVRGELVAVILSIFGAIVLLSLLLTSLTLFSAIGGTIPEGRRNVPIEDLVDAPVVLPEIEPVLVPEEAAVVVVEEPSPELIPEPEIIPDAPELVADPELVPEPVGGLVLEIDDPEGDVRIIGGMGVNADLIAEALEWVDISKTQISIEDAQVIFEVWVAKPPPTSLSDSVIRIGDPFRADIEGFGFKIRIDRDLDRQTDYAIEADIINQPFADRGTNGIFINFLAQEAQLPRNTWRLEGERFPGNIEMNGSKLTITFPLAYLALHDSFQWSVSVGYWAFCCSPFYEGLNLELLDCVPAAVCSPLERDGWLEFQVSR